MSRETLRDRLGNKIAEIESHGSKQVIRDRLGNKLGEYDSRDNVTRDRLGNRIGSGNLLSRLIA